MVCPYAVNAGVSIALITRAVLDAEDVATESSPVSSLPPRSASTCSNRTSPTGKQPQPDRETRHPSQPLC